MYATITVQRYLDVASCECDRRAWNEVNKLYMILAFASDNNERWLFISNLQKQNSFSFVMIWQKKKEEEFCFIKLDNCSFYNASSLKQ